MKKLMPTSKYVGTLYVTPSRTIWSLISGVSSMRRFIGCSRVHLEVFKVNT